MQKRSTPLSEIRRRLSARHARRSRKRDRLLFEITYSKDAAYSAIRFEVKAEPCLPGAAAVNPLKPLRRRFMPSPRPAVRSRSSLAAQFLSREALSFVLTDLGSRCRVSQPVINRAGVAELADARDLKSLPPQGGSRFDPGLRHQPSPASSIRFGGSGWQATLSFVLGKEGL